MNSLLGVDDFAAADGVADFGEGGDVVGGIGGKDDEVGVRAFGDVASMGGIAEALRGICRERGKNLLETHAGAGHPRELFRSVELIDVADIGAEQNLSTSLGIGPHLGQRRLVHSLFEVRGGNSSEFDMPQRQRGDKSHVRRLQALDERRTPRATFRCRVREDVHPALQRDFNSLQIGRMRKNRFALAMRFGDDGFCDVDRHDQNAVLFNGTGKNLYAVRAVVNLLAHSLDALGGRFDVGNADVIGFEKSLHVNGRSAFPPERFADGENPGPFYFAGFHAMTDEIRVLEDGPDVKDRGEAPARQHLFELGSELLGRKFLGVEQAGREDVDVAVPKASRNDQPFAVNYGRVAWNFDDGRRTDGDDAAVADKDGAVFDRWFCGRGVNLCADQSEVIRANKAAYQKRGEQEKGESDSHLVNIRERREESSEREAGARLGDGVVVNR